MEDIGAQIREERQRKGWTLDALAKESGLSPGFLSQVERGLSTLSIVSLSSICRALGIPIESVFSSSGPLDRHEPVVTAADQQLHIQIGRSPITYRYLSGQLPSEPIEELLIAEFPAGCVQEHSAHEGQEFGYLLEGSLVLRVRDEEHPLSQGDSYHISASEPHGYRTAASAGAKVLMAVTQRFIEVPGDATERPARS